MSEPTITERLLRVLLRTPGMTTPQLVDALDGAVTTSHANRFCRQLERRGWAQRIAGTHSRNTRWTASDRLRTHGVAAALMPNVRDRVRDLVDDGVREIPELVRLTGSSHATVCSLVKRMEAHGVLRRVRVGVRTYVEPWPDDLEHAA